MSNLIHLSTDELVTRLKDRIRQYEDGLITGNELRFGAGPMLVEISKRPDTTGIAQPNSPVADYRPGRVSLMKDQSGRFSLNGDFDSPGREIDHFQLIYEALEIAGQSEDLYASQFQGLCREIGDLSSDWCR